jgi:hypothetical protein
MTAVIGFPHKNAPDPSTESEAIGETLNQRSCDDRATTNRKRELQMLQLGYARAVMLTRARIWKSAVFRALRAMRRIRFPPFPHGIKLHAVVTHRLVETAMVVLCTMLFQKPASRPKA